MKAIKQGCFYYHRELDMVVYIAKVFSDLRTKPQTIAALAEDLESGETVMVEWDELEDVPQDILKLLYEQRNKIPPQG